MKTNEKFSYAFWCFKACFLTCLAQVVGCYLVSFFIRQFGLTDERIGAWVAPYGPVVTNLQGGGDLIGNILLVIRSGQFWGLCVAIVFFRILIIRRVPSGFWWLMVLVFLGSLGVSAMTSWQYLLTALAESVPACAWVIHKYRGLPGLSIDDYHNMGGDYYRGAQIVKGERTFKAFNILCQQEGAGGISIFPGHPYVYQKESEHGLVVGSPGSGKTQIIHHWAEEVYKRPNDKAIFWDIKGIFTQSFVDRPGVDLLAAWDARSIAWAPDQDIKNHLDAQQMAEFIIPRDSREFQEHFPNSAREVLQAVFFYLDGRGTPWGWGDLWAVISSGRKELCALLSSFKDGKSAAKLIEGDNSRSAEDVYSTLLSKTQRTIRWFAKAWPKGGQSIKQWVHEDSKFLILGGIPERAEMADATANIVIPLIINEVLSLEDDPNRRIWLFLDELATLGKMEDLLKAFALGRSKGLCVVAGIQDMGKIEHNYSAALAKSISNTFGTKIILRCSDVDTSLWASKTLGDQDFHEKQITITEGSSETTKSQQYVLRTRPIFTPTEIANFENLTGVLQVSSWPLLYFKWAYQPIVQKAKLIEPASWISQKSSLLDDSATEQGTTKPWGINT